MTKYEFKLPAETGWLGVAVAAGSVAAALTGEYTDMSDTSVVAIGTFVGTAFRYLGGLFLARFGVDDEATD